jgi:hypothetical protein
MRDSIHKMTINSITYLERLLEFESLLGRKAAKKMGIRKWVARASYASSFTRSPRSNSFHFGKV